MANKVRESAIVITGASSGIGRATALACAREGGFLVLSARRDAALQSLVQECQQAGGQAIAVPADVTSQEEMENLAREAARHFGRIDAWFNNAGVTVAGRFEEVPPDVYRQVIETNLFGTINGSRAVLPYFREQGRGTLINHASVLSNFGASHFSAYCASKFGIRGFSESLRQELRDSGISVCILMPAAIDTPLYNQAANFSGRGVRPVHPVYSADRVADAVVGLIKRPQPEAIVGNAGRAVSVARQAAPYWLSDRIIGRQWEMDHFTDEPADPSTGNLFSPDEQHTGVSGGWTTQDGSNARYIAAGAAVTIPAVILWRQRSRDRSHSERARAGISGQRRRSSRILNRARPVADRRRTRLRIR